MGEDYTIFNISENSKDAFIALDTEGRVIVWNKEAERMFGYKRREVIGKEAPVLPDELKNEIEIVRRRLLRHKKLTYVTTRKDKSGNLFDVVIAASQISDEANNVVGYSAVIRELSSIEEVRVKKDYMNLIGEKKLKIVDGTNPDPIDGNKKNGKRSFVDIRKAILQCLETGQNTINQISYKTRINWKTVELHLTYLVGKGLVRSVFSSGYVKIFELTKKGEQYIRLHQSNERNLTKMLK